MFKKIILFSVLVLSLQANDLVIKESKCGVNSTVKALKEVIKSKGLDIFAVINHSANAKSVGLKLNPTVMIVFGKAKLGTKLMQQDPRVGLDLPLRVLVYKDKDSKTKLAYRDGEFLKKRFVIDAPKIINKINNGLDKITNKAIAECRK